MQFQILRVTIFADKPLRCDPNSEDSDMNINIPLNLGVINCVFVSFHANYL